MPYHYNADLSEITDKVAHSDRALEKQWYRFRNTLLRWYNMVRDVNGIV